MRKRKGKRKGGVRERKREERSDLQTANGKKNFGVSSWMVEAAQPAGR